MAYRQVVEFGMSPTIGHISLPHKKPSEPAKRMYSDKLARMIDEVYTTVVILPFHSCISFSTLYRIMQNGLEKVVTRTLCCGPECRLLFLLVIMECCLFLKIGRGWSITIIIIVPNFRKFKFRCNKSAHVYTCMYLYILIHPCILGNRGVITKILTSPRQL